MALTLACIHFYSRYILLNSTDQMNVVPNGSTFKIANDGTYSQIDQQIDVNNPYDNYYTSFIKSVEAVFFWTSGRWDQLDQWNFWPVDVYSIIGSILLVTILQNMLIAIMT